MFGTKISCQKKYLSKYIGPKTGTVSPKSKGKKNLSKKNFGS